MENNNTIWNKTSKTTIKKIAELIEILYQVDKEIRSLNLVKGIRDMPLASDSKSFLHYQFTLRTWSINFFNKLNLLSL
jgi:hypothetical protein